MLKGRKKKISLKYARPETDFIFPKSKFELGPEFEKTELGYSEDEIRQYRGPKNQHVLEYKTYYKGHRDEINPNEDPLGHLIIDAPESIIAILAGTILAFIGALLLFRWKEKKKSKREDPTRTRYEYIFWLFILILILIITIIGIFFIVKYLRESNRQTIVRR